MSDAATQSYFARELVRIRDLTTPGGSVTARIIAAKRHLEAHYAEAPDFDALSRRACLSRFHFIRQFRRLYGRSPYQFLKSVRIRRARELLNAAPRCGKRAWRSATTAYPRSPRCSGA